MEKLMEITFITFRPSSCLEIDIQSVSTIDADRPASFFCHSYFCHHRPRVLHWGASQNMLQYIRLRFALRVIAYPKIVMPDQIVRDGMNTIVPCSADPPDTAPPGAYICNASEAICLEKWRVRSGELHDVENVLINACNFRDQTLA